MGRPPRDAEPLITLFKSRLVATAPEIMGVLGTKSRMTAYRVMQRHGGLSSYSHKGSFYTLDRVAKFDSRGLWSHQEARFSRWGTLMRTTVHFVESSDAGYYTPELDVELQIETKEPLLAAFRSGKISREKVAGRYLYCAANEVARESQLRARTHPSIPVGSDTEEQDSPISQVKAALVLFVSSLDEKQRRLYAGLESLKLGHGGDRVIAELLEIDPRTVSRGRRELLAEEVDTSRVRKLGGGRPRVEKKSQK